MSDIKIFLYPTYLLHLVFVTVHNTDTEHQLLCIIIIKNAIQVITKTWWRGGATRSLSIGLVPQSLFICTSLLTGCSFDSPLLLTEPF